MHTIFRRVIMRFIGTMGVLAGALMAHAATLETGNGLQLEVSDQGRITGLRIGQTTLPLKSPGGFAIADFENQPKPVNLVPNPGFEDGTHGWHLGRGQSLDSTMAHSGKASVRLEVPGPESRSSNLQVVVPVKPHTRYHVGLWLRRENVGVCGAYLSERDDRNQLTGKRGQVGAGIPKQDGLWHLAEWNIITEPKTTRLLLRADIYRSTGTLWLDDYFVEEVNEGIYQAVEGRTGIIQNGIRLDASLPGQGIGLQATLRADKECLRIDGMVNDTTGHDRAIGVKFALPLDLTGWRWYHDAEERETIDTARTYRHTYNCVSGVGACSIYPWSAASGPAAGLSLALPLSQGPRVFLLQHDQRTPETSLTFFFGLTKDAGHHPSRAPFSLVVYPHDPAWGMRSAMQRYYRLFPESFVKRPTFEGYLNYADEERFDPKEHQLIVRHRDRIDDASDFGEGYKFLWHVHGCYDFRQVAYENPKLPPDETVFSLLQGMIASEQTKSRGYTPTSETMKKIVFGPQGRISYIADTQYWRPHEGYNHTDHAGWGFNFRVNEDPDVSPFLAEMARSKAQQYAQDPARRPWDSMFTADAIEGYMANAACLDFRREHFKTTLVPLTFGSGNLRPGMPNTIWDSHRKAWWPITQQHQIVIHGNANGYEQFFTMPYVDVPMTEGSWDVDHIGRWERFLRAVNYRKIWRHWHAWNKRGGYGDRDPANVQEHFRHCLAYAIYPALACVQDGSGDIEPHRAWYRQYVPAIEELSVAGWDPVPYATASEGVVVERFGDYAQGELHFTLHNYAGKPVETIMKPDWNALGAPAGEELVVMDILPGTPQLAVFPREGYRVEIEADGSRAFWVGTRRQAAQHGFRMAAASLKKIERFFATEMQGAAKGSWENALSTAEAGMRAEGPQALELAETLQRLAEKNLPTDLATRSPIDLAKLLFRLRTQVSLVPVAILGIQSNAPRHIADAVRGQSAAVTWELGLDHTSVEQTRVCVISPWPGVADKCRIESANPLERKVNLAVPTEIPRRLLPYLLEVRGKIGACFFTVATPVDVEVGAPIKVAVSPQRVLRGQVQTIEVTVVNRLDEDAKLVLKWKTPAHVTIKPAEMTLAIASKGSEAQSVSIALDKNVTIGDLRLLYTIADKNPRFTCDGPIFLVVGDPAPPVK